MSLPPVEALLAPVTCMPPWVAKYAAYPNTVVASGYSINADGNLPADPATLARAASAKLGINISLEAYTLARYVTSEVGTYSVPERVAVVQDALNRVRYIEKLGSVLSLLLYRQSASGPNAKNRGFYGPIHGKVNGVTSTSTAPYGRWAATSKDPTVSNIMLVLGVLNGDIPADFNKGGDDQLGPDGLNDPVASVKNHGYSRRQYWVGPLPGVNPFRTFTYRTMKDLDPNSQLGQFLIMRGVAAMQGSRPDWSKLPTCEAPKPKSLIGIIFSAAGLTTAAIVGAMLYRRRRFPTVALAGIDGVGAPLRTE